MQQRFNLSLHYLKLLFMEILCIWLSEVNLMFWSFVMINIFCHINSYLKLELWYAVKLWIWYAVSIACMPMFSKTFMMNHMLYPLGSSFVTVFAGCGHSYWRASSLLHGTGGTAVWSRSWWWRLWGIWGDAGAGTECTGQDFISYWTHMSKPSPSHRQ